MEQLTSNSNDLVAKVRDEAKRLQQVAKGLREQNQDSNEQFTKTAMILPMLRALGYTTDSFPPEVRPEHQIKLEFSKAETKYVDYAIHIDNAPTPSIFVEKGWTLIRYVQRSYFKSYIIFLGKQQRSSERFY